MKFIIHFIGTLGSEASGYLLCAVRYQQHVYFGVSRVTLCKKSSSANVVSKYVLLVWLIMSYGVNIETRNLYEAMFLIYTF